MSLLSCSWLPCCFVYCFFLASLGESLRGSGTASVSELAQQWVQAYQAASNATPIAYQVVASEDGNAEAVLQSNDFYITEVVPSVTSGEGLQPLPAALIPMVCSYNVPTISLTVTLSVSVLASIWAGNITNWADPQLQALNPGMSLPNATIVLIAYEGVSGYTATFTSMLSQLSQEWRASMGTFSNASYFTGGESNASTILYYAGQDPTQLSTLVMSTPHSLSYVTLRDSMAYGTTFALLLNGYGYASFPLPAVAQAALSNLHFTPQLTASTVGMPGLMTYPLLSLAYIVIPLNTSTSCEVTSEVYAFLRWVYTSTAARTTATQLGYFPVPAATTSLVLDRLASGLQCEESSLLAGQMAAISASGGQCGSLLMSILEQQYTSINSKVLFTYRQTNSSDSLLWLNSPAPQASTLAVLSVDVTQADFLQAAYQVVPVVMFGLALVCNLPGLPAGVTMGWSREIVVGVFNGTVASWDHPLVTALNPFVMLPSSPILVVMLQSGEREPDFQAGAGVV